MNRIFKKIWNKHRGCFVAVSEAMTSASQRAGKASVVVGAVSLLMSLPTANALTTISGNATFDNLPIRWSSEPSAYNYVNDDALITGNLVYDSGSSILFVGNTSGSVGIPSITVTVEKDFTVASGKSWTIAHNHNRSQDVFGSTVVHGNAYIYGCVEVGTRNTKHQGNITSNLAVNGTLYNYGTVRNNQDNINGDANLTGTLSIGTLRNQGTFQMLGGTVTGTFGNIEQVSGTFKQSANNNFYVSNSLTLTGGTLDTAESLLVGERGGNFSIGSSLILGGGSLTQTSLLTQKAGSISVTAGNYTFGTLNKSNGTLSNAGTLTLTNFNQSGGTASNSGNLTIGNANLYGSLSNTGTLNLTGTVTSRGNLSSSGTLNNRGNWTETNTYAISGNLNNTGSVNFQNGFTLASNSRLTSSGTLQTNNVYNIFDSLGTTGQQDLHYVSLNSTAPQEIKTSLSDFFQKYVAGTVAQDLINHASFTGGKVIVTNAHLTETQKGDLINAFKSKIFSPFS